MTPNGLPGFRRALLRWYDSHKRDLPWRHTSDPYRIWLSEVMLQQTTVRTVMPRWERFLERWPTVSALASAPVDDVLHEWSGLGYYARARNLHRAAGAVINDFEGEFPARFELLLALPGMGPYTAAAVASIAFGEPVPLVDANVERVLARLYAIEEDIKAPATKKRLYAQAGELLARKRPGDFNQAMMELGATVCLPPRPRCEVCPVERYCAAKEKGIQATLPMKTAKPPIEAAREAAVLLEQDGRILLLLRPKEVSFGGMWELPRVRCIDNEESDEAAARAARELAGLEIESPVSVCRVTHTVMRSRITLLVYRPGAWRGRVRLSRNHEEHRWVTPAEWAGLPRSTAQRRVAETLFGKIGKQPSDGEAESDGASDLFD